MSEVAATKELTRSIRHSQTGILSDGRNSEERAHRTQNEDADDEEMELLEEIWDEPSVECEKCFETLDEVRWEVEPEGAEVSDEDHELWVRCEGCGHEIEFGYSHEPSPEPIHGGRIWPCESNDFNPWCCIPDLRYRDDWERRGWIRPARNK